MRALARTWSHGRHGPGLLPKAPVFGWDNLWSARQVDVPCMADLLHTTYTTSGRAALYAALLQIDLRPGTGVLVPTYHCPTMVAPIIEAGLRPVFYGLGDDGLPDLAQLTQHSRANQPGAIFVAHYFGLTKSLHAVRDWCDQRGVILVEDCAHAYFGMAGERPVGHWGDFATASLSKFFPVPEGGLLGSAHRPLRQMSLTRPGLPSQLKSAWDIVDLACQYGRLAGVSHAMKPLHWLRSARRQVPSHAALASGSTSGTALDSNVTDCDMGRRSSSASVAARLLHSVLPAARVVRRRRENYAQLVNALACANQAHVLNATPPRGCVPYVLPLWVADAARADVVYESLRMQRLPVFRWDRVWPGTPVLAGDTGRAWNRQVLQLLCHQDLSAEDTQFLGARVLDALSNTARTSLASPASTP